jgi:hypothetical protein
MWKAGSASAWKRCESATLDANPDLEHQHGNSVPDRPQIKTSVPDPDLYVFGPPGYASGSVVHKYGSGSGSFSFLIKVLSGLK